jgi:hypothetical protein
MVYLLQLGFKLSRARPSGVIMDGGEDDNVERTAKLPEGDARDVDNSSLGVSDCGDLLFDDVRFP